MIPIIDQHRSLPPALRVWVITPATMVLVIALGLSCTLPSGPLCDEGMVLFMEGGCDWGLSNVFFYSKLGLLLIINVAFAIAWRRGVRTVLGFVPHFAVLLYLSYVHRYCESSATYYSHPNGSIGQMTLEALAFAISGIALLHRFDNDRNWLRLMVVILLWNALHVAVFYGSLVITNHWTWLHSVLIVGMLLLTGLWVAPPASARFIHLVAISLSLFFILLTVHDFIIHGLFEQPAFHVAHFEAGAGGTSLVIRLFLALTLTILLIFSAIPEQAKRMKVVCLLGAVAVILIFHYSAFGIQKFGDGFDESVYRNLIQREQSGQSVSIEVVHKKLGEPLAIDTRDAVSGWIEAWLYSYMPSGGYGWDKRVLYFDATGLLCDSNSSSEP